MRTKICLILVLAISSCVVAKDEIQLGFHNQQNGWSPKISLKTMVAPKVTMWLRQGIGCSDPASLAGYTIFSPGKGNGEESSEGVFFIGISAKENLRISALRMELSLEFKTVHFSPDLWLGYGANLLGGKDDLGFLSTCCYKHGPKDKNSFGYRVDGTFFPNGQEQFIRAGILWKHKVSQAFSLTSWFGGEHKTKTCVARIMLKYVF